MRRTFVPQLHPGRVPLPDSAAHHLLRVLRLRDGDEVELFDAGGRTARAVLRVGAHEIEAEVVMFMPQDSPAAAVRVASAVPKGERADWLVEKLAELGAAEWWPLQTERSVVVPKGEAKRARWERIAQEAARQSGAPGVLRIADLTPLPVLLSGLVRTGDGGLFGSTAGGARPVVGLTATELRGGWCLIGPEGGWTPGELEKLSASGLVPVSLGPTVLRVETACVLAAAAAVWTLRAPDPARPASALPSLPSPPAAPA